MADQELTFDQLGADFEKMAELASSQISVFLKDCGRMMINVIRLRFATGSGPDGDKWLSTAANTKYGGRWSSRYTRHGELSSGSIRLFWTGELMRSFTELACDEDHVVIGPKGDIFETIADVASNRWGNEIVGWDDQSIDWTKREMEAFSMKVLTSGQK